MFYSNPFTKPNRDAARGVELNPLRKNAKGRAFRVIEQGKDGLIESITTYATMREAVAHCVLNGGAIAAIGSKGLVAHKDHLGRMRFCHGASESFSHTCRRCLWWANWDN